MSQVVTFELSDDEYQAVERAAKLTGQRPAEWAATKLRQQLSVSRNGSPHAVLRAMLEPPHVSSGDVSKLEEAIEEGKLAVDWKPVFNG